MPELRSPDTATIARGLRRWLFSGACQSESGAFCAWRDASTGRLAFEYPEITGYLLTFAAGLDDLEEHEITASRRGADWLVSRLRQGDRSAREGWDGGAVYTFDLAMLANGLLAFGRRFDDEYVEAGAAVVDFLHAEIRAAGHLPAVARGPVPAHTGWATEGRAHLLKAVQCLLLASEAAGRETREAAASLIAEAETLQQPDGRFITGPGDGLTMLHPHHYALEGLWIWGRATGEEWAMERARAGVEWAFCNQLPSRGFPRFVLQGGDGTGPEQADASAQAVRMAYLVELEPERLGLAVERLGELTIGDQIERASVYQPETNLCHENVWSTLFAAQALDLVGGNQSQLEPLLLV
jgi:hypothetical protein